MIHLRATRETELAETFPIHVVCEWIGNSAAIAAKHYLQVTDEHYQQASEKAAHNPAQYDAVTTRKGQDAETRNPAFTEEYDTLRYHTERKVGGTGLEPDAANPYTVNDLGKSAESSAAECAALFQECGLLPYLATLIEAWPCTPPEIRRLIMALVTNNLTQSNDLQ